jgi:hypothetical protein
VLVPPTRWLWLVDHRAFNGGARSFKAGNRGELSFKARSLGTACSSRNAPPVTLARVAVMALARSGQERRRVPHLGQRRSRSSIVACWIPAMMSARQSPQPSRYGRVALSEEAATYFQRHRCQVQLLPTPAVIPVWNQAEGAVIAILHVTC